MFESFQSFADYVQEYDLERAEGLLLRHLNSVYKVLSQTVPDGAKTDAVLEMELYLREMLRHVDSSLLDEWERMLNPGYLPAEAAGADLRPPRPEEPPDVTGDTRAFTASIRTRVFAFLRAWSIGEDEAALEAIDSPNDGDGEPWTTDRLRAARGATASSTPTSASTPRRGTSVTPTSNPPTTGQPGACSRCSWIRRASTTGSRSSTWTSAPRAKRASRSYSCGASAASSEPGAYRLPKAISARARTRTAGRESPTPPRSRGSRTRCR